jgi:hypothetical protein
MKFFGMKGKRPAKPIVSKTPAEVKLDMIRDILFPPSESHIDKDGRKFLVDFSADLNLDSALSDLEDGYNDKACQQTIKKISNRIFEVRKILEAHQEITDAEYLIVDDLAEEAYEKVQASDREH